MTLGRLVVAWLLVTIWFGISLWVNLFIVAGLLRLAGRLQNTTGVMGSISLPLLYWRLPEAIVLTLFASLWFDSLGSGGWWLVFFLLGLLVTVPMQLVHARSYRTLEFAAGELGELLRYLIAGALLAWRLS